MNRRLNLSTYLTCCNRIKSVQKLHAQQRADINMKHKDDNDGTLREDEEKMSKEMRDGPVSSVAKVV